MTGKEDTPDGMEQAGEVHDLMGARMVRSSPLLEEAWRYWSSLRNGAALPRRDALDPRAMSFILGHSMILDRIRPGTIRVRLAGQIVHDLMGMEVRGLPVRAFFSLDDRTRAVQMIEQVFETPATLQLNLQSDGAEGRLGAKMLVLPLLDHTGRPTKALCCFNLDGLVTDAPRRFDVVDQCLTPVHTPRSAPRRRVEDVLPVEMAEDQAAFAPSPVPWLRVVK